MTYIGRWDETHRNRYFWLLHIVCFAKLAAARPKCVKTWWNTLSTPSTFTDSAATQIQDIATAFVTVHHAWMKVASSYKNPRQVKAILCLPPLTAFWHSRKRLLQYAKNVKPSFQLSLTNPCTSFGWITHAPQLFAKIAKRKCWPTVRSRLCQAMTSESIWDPTVPSLSRYDCAKRTNDSKYAYLVHEAHQAYCCPKVASVQEYCKMLFQQRNLSQVLGLGTTIIEMKKHQDEQTFILGHEHWSKSRIAIKEVEVFSIWVTLGNPKRASSWTSFYLAALTTVSYRQTHLYFGGHAFKLVQLTCCGELGY